MDMVDISGFLTDTQRQRWMAYIDWQRQQPPGSLTRTMRADIEITTVDELIHSIVQDVDQMIDAWWQNHPELHPSELSTDA